jgi:murein DD-endopeptidase MepM/ murein hydrolase activator NlpD
VRTDYLSLAGDGTRFGLSKGDEYPAPLGNYWWVRGQNQNQNPGEANHLGWDFSANPGEPIRCGPGGGFVMKLYTCTRCTDDQPNVLSQGIPLNSSSVLTDPAWGYGYGNAVLMRYTNDLLPESTKARLVKAGMSGAHLFVIYAHMSAVSVQLQQTVPVLGQIGVIGNTGNSSALHVHVEVHAGLNANDTNWGSMRNFDPEILFLR